MNSSKTWKSGEISRVSGTYRCQACHLVGRENLKEVREGAVFPMCEDCPEKDATWRLTKTGVSGAAVP